MRLFRRILIGILAAVMAVGLPFLARGWRLYKEATRAESLADKAAAIAAAPDYTELSQLPEGFIAELLRSEDRRFYYHPGIDPAAILRAAYHDIRAGAFVEGGSTITQQLAKNLYFSFEKRLDRKAAELFAALDLERAYTKDEILELYVNVIYFGEGCYGIGAAARHYYGVAPGQLGREQIAALIRTIKCPNYCNPHALAPQGA